MGNKSEYLDHVLYCIEVLGGHCQPLRMYKVLNQKDCNAPKLVSLEPEDERFDFFL